MMDHPINPMQKRDASGQQTLARESVWSVIVKIIKPQTLHIVKGIAITFFTHEILKKTLNGFVIPKIQYV